MKIRAVETIII